ncbi:MAG: SPOR domain-containing protein [Legionella sp.]|uniref:SPOR domain-containing protein n=1 Tax=Legionella sp. TaxID=459 RepID=UPI0039E50CD5
MNNKIKFAIVGFCALEMCSCVVLENGTTENLYYPTYAPYDRSQFYTQNFYNWPNSNYKYNYKQQEAQEVIVPDSYHVGDMRSPVSFHDRDQTWVNNQKPQNYTIQLADGDKPSKVAQTLYRAPRSDRTAQVKYQRDGKDYYRGVYGSYSDAAQAQKALDSLPVEMRSNASIKNWGSIQQQ